jgi:lysozyme
MLPKFNLHRRSNAVVLYDGVPMLRKHAWALADARHHGVHFVVNSADRRDSTIAKFKGKGLKAGYNGQKYLYDTYNSLAARYGREGAIARGFFPANPPNRTSHTLHSDGNPHYKTPAGGKLAPYKLGIDAVNKPGGDSKELVAWLNAHGYHAVNTYSPSLAERHHFNFVADPATNARKRLARAYASIAKAKITPRPTRLSDNGVKTLVGFEGVSLRPYNDPVGYATIGVGHLLHKSPVTQADKDKYKNFTAADATKLLRADVKTREAAVDDLVKPKLTQNQFDALVSFAFNEGVGALQNSALLKKLNAGDTKGAADEFLKWNKSNGKVLPGLVKRREAERALFLK